MGHNPGSRLAPPSVARFTIAGLISLVLWLALGWVLSILTTVP